MILGNTGQTGLLEAANLAQARRLISASPNPFEAGNLIEKAKAANPAIEIAARAHSDAGVAHLKALGADHIVLGEREIAREMVNALCGDRDTFTSFENADVSPADHAPDRANA